MVQGFNYDEYDEVDSVASDSDTSNTHNEYDAMYHEWNSTNSRADGNVEISEYTITQSQQQQLYYDASEKFTHDLAEMISRREADAFNIMVIVRDVEIHEQTVLRMRYDTEDVVELAEHIRNSTARRYGKSDGVGSDNVSSKLVIWDLS